MSWQPTMTLRVRRYIDYSYAETRGAQHEDTLQQLWVNPDAEYPEEATEWRSVPIEEVR